MTSLLSRLGDAVTTGIGNATATRRGARALRQGRTRTWLSVGTPSPLVRQSPILVLFVAATVLTGVLPTLTITSGPALVAALGLVVGATILAGVLSTRRGWWAYANAVPAIDFLAIGVLRFATGESRSIFAALVILPVVWVAASAGRRYIVFAFLGVFIAVLVPFSLGGSLEANPNELWRGFFSATCFGVAAVVVNELARVARIRFDRLAAREIAKSEELERAAAVQRALLPRAGVAVAGYEMAGACLPSKEVGGDFFDWFPTPEGFAVTLGDVMGKGVGAGMIAATARAVVRSARTDDDPAEAVRRVDECLSSELADAASFATLFHARVRAVDGRLEYADAGHGLSLIVHPDGTWERLESNGFPAGLALLRDWSTKVLHLREGDMVVTFSDGLLDVFDGTLDASAEVARLASEAASPDDLVRALSRLAGGFQQPDDVTVLAVRRTPHAG